jgi:hypothetical protein
MRSTCAQNGERHTEAAAMPKREEHALGVGLHWDCAVVRSHAISSGGSNNTDGIGLRSEVHRMGG